MPPNAKGGKGFKKKKKGENTTQEPVFLERAADQTVGRVIRMLGNRNVLCYCNDNRLRICHIRGGMRKSKCCIEAGDVVLLSLRDTISEDGRAALRGDILNKYDPEQFRSLRREPNVNEKLFMKLELMDGLTLGEIGVDKSKDKNLEKKDDFGFVFEGRGEDGETESDSDSEETEAAAELRNAKPKVRGGRQDQATAAAVGGADELDIDTI